MLAGASAGRSGAMARRNPSRSADMPVRRRVASSLSKTNSSAGSCGARGQGHEVDPGPPERKLAAVATPELALRSTVDGLDGPGR